MTNSEYDELEKLLKKEIEEDNDPDYQQYITIIRRDTNDINPNR